MLTLTLREALGYPYSLSLVPCHFSLFMRYTVQQLADLAGVSVRTLHHYDEIKLLSPQRASNNYRTYGEEELLTLQQILFFRELEFSLEDIAKILAKPDFDMSKALDEHRTEIQKKQLRLVGLLGTIDKTLLKLSGKKEMTDEELFDAFWEKHEKEYAPEAEARWGHTDAYKQSKERTKHLTKEDYKRMAKDADVFMKDLAKCIDSGPKSAETQKMIAQHYESLRTFYDPTPELYRGLGQMYVVDPRFRAYFEKYDKRMPEFMREAMGVHCEWIEKNKC